ncbi:MAG TPA: hypothetical protein VG871_04185 [Vicinamibacterales bacterium]|nr:hypothetical protein [Vicinamibacterales bacterium]
MTYRRVILPATVAAFVAAAALVVAQEPAATKAPHAAAIPRTADGHPDFQGSWSTETFTPFERPAAFKDQEFFTAQQAAAYADQQRERQEEQADFPVHYDNAIWMSEKTPRGMTTLRTSIVTTRDGKVPPMNAEGRARAAAKAAERKKADPFASAQSRGLSERCIYWAHEGPPLLPTGYNNNLEIAQSPDSFVIIPEMMPVARVAPLDGRPHLASDLRNIRGDQRAHWDGDTMVIESANFTDRTAFRGSSEHLTVTERLTMLDADTIRYQFTITDPHTWDTPWTGEYEMKRTNYPMYEYACHEGNYGMANTLRAARKAEADAKKAAAGTSTQQ